MNPTLDPGNFRYGEELRSKLKKEEESNARFFSSAEGVVAVTAACAVAGSAAAGATSASTRGVPHHSVPPPGGISPPSDAWRDAMLAKNSDAPAAKATPGGNGEMALTELNADRMTAPAAVAVVVAADNDELGAE